MTQQPNHPLGGDEAQQDTPCSLMGEAMARYKHDEISAGDALNIILQQAKRFNAAPVLPVEVREGDVWSNIKARLAAQIALAEDHLNSTVSIRLRDAKTILSTIKGDA